jgi:sec-independent protein translocase protein TatC
MTDEFEEEHFEEKPFLEHLEDLRTTLIKIIVATVVGALVCLAISSRIFRVLQAPIGYSPLTGRYAWVVYGQSAPSATSTSQDQTPKHSPLSPGPGRYVIVTGPLGRLIMLASDLFVFSREGFSLLNLRPAAKKDPSPPGPPKGVSASDTYADRVRVTWKASSGATSYEVWRSKKKKSRFASRLTKVSGTSYDDTSPRVGRAYSYWVKAKNSSGTSRFSARESGRRLPTVRIIETGPTKGFIVVIKTSVIFGLGVTFPLNLFFLAQFVFPALTHKEKRYVTPAFFLGGVLFVMGLLFGYLLTLPLALRIFVNLNVRYQIENTWRMSEYLGTVSKLLIANGVIFEMPLILTILVRIGVLSVTTLRKKRRHAIVILFVVGAMLSPPDAPTMFMVAVPMLVMYEACIWVSWLLMRKKRRREQEEEERERGEDERRRLKRAERVEPEDKRDDTPSEPPEEQDSGAPPDDYTEDYWHEDKNGYGEWPEEGDYGEGDMHDNFPEPDEETPGEDEEQPDRRDD